MRINHADITYDELIEAIKESGGTYDIDKINKAYLMAKEAHKNQKRRSGEPYIIHPVTVAGILVELGMDTDSLVAALLHDVVEDTDVTLDDIKKQFGQDVALLVDGVTKLGKLPYVSMETQQAENLRKMLLAMDEDIRVIIIKLADRLHNVNTLKYMPEQKQRDIALETLEVFAPIAHRLGIRAVKEELEDLSIRYLDPVAHEEIEKKLHDQLSEREGFIKKTIEEIKERLGNTYEHVAISGRVKSVHGIYRKMYMQGKSFEEIYDIYAVRIIVDSVVDCYNVLGIMHDMFSPIPGRFKDYISTPKPNNYQSLHTTVVSHTGITFEIQIRTWEMHHTAEYGIAAHWKYKAGMKDGKTDSMQDRLSWIRQLLENQKVADDVVDIVRTIKTDLAPEEVFAITPKGDVKSLPTGATVIDFAYSIHSEVGNHLIGAKVNGKIVPINHVIQTGDVIEIITSQAAGRGPSRDWLKIVKTGEARNKIRAWYKKERRPENIVEGKNEIEREFTRNKIILPSAEYESFIKAIAERTHCASVEDFYAAIGYGGIILSRIMPRIKDDYIKIEKEKRQQENDVQPAPVPVPKKVSVSSSGVVVEGIDNCLIKLSRCCDPLPGDQIIGYITRGHGVSIHKRNCLNVPKVIEESEEPDRWIRAYWNDSVKETFKSTLKILSIDRAGVLADVTVTLNNMRVLLHSASARQIKGGNCEVVVTVSIENAEHLERVMARLGKIQGVISVDRFNV